MKYRKKPVEIEALQWTGENHREMFNFLGGRDTEGKSFYLDFDKTIGALAIKTLEGWQMPTLDDYIIKGIKGEYYNCREDIFHLTYDKA